MKKRESVTTIKMVVFTYSLFSHFISVSSYKSTLLKSIRKQELFIKIVNEAQISIYFTVKFFITSRWNEKQIFLKSATYLGG